MIAISEVEKIHDILIQRFSGATGIRDKSVLASAIVGTHAAYDKINASTI